MRKQAVIYINPNYDDTLIEHNRDMVGYVVEKKSGKVQNTAIIARGSLADWYADRGSRFDSLNYDFLIGSISIIGVLHGTANANVEEEKYDPLAYRVN